MSVPKGMQRGELLLSAEEQREHGLETVEAITLRDLGDGWVTNTPPNAHLAGSLVHHRSGERNLGRKRWEQFVPIDNELHYIAQVTSSIQDRQDQLIGAVDESGAPVPGELQQLDELRMILTSWLSVTPDRKEDGSSAVEASARKRQQAIHPTEQELGERLRRILGLEDSTGRKNPGAVLAQLPNIEKLFIKRYGDFTHQLGSEHARSARTLHWIFEEDRLLAQIDAALLSSLEHQTPDDLDFLLRLARHVKFRVQPFNYLERELAIGGINDAQPLQNLEAGLRLMRFKNYLLTPFRRMTGMSNETIQGLAADTISELMLDIHERTAFLEEMSLQGVYGKLADRLAVLGNSALGGLMLRNPEVVHQMGEEFKTVATRHCLPGEKENTALWYGQRLRQAA